MEPHNSTRFLLVLTSLILLSSILLASMTVVSGGGNSQVKLKKVVLDRAMKSWSSGYDKSFAIRMKPNKGASTGVFDVVFKVKMKWDGVAGIGLYVFALNETETNSKYKDTDMLQLGVGYVARGSHHVYQYSTQKIIDDYRLENWTKSFQISIKRL